MPPIARVAGQGDPAVQGAVAVGALVRAWRERALLTQEQLAALAGLNARTVRRLETGELQRPRSSSVRSLAEALGLDAAEVSLLARAASPAPRRPRPGPGPGPAGVVPRQLPADVAVFVGRARELALVDEARAGDALVITAIDGMGGVGKTALAVHAAHRLAGRFPDGQLYVNLQGYAPGPPLSPMQALATLLRALGVSPDQVPVEQQEAAGLYRSMLAGKRVLVVLDNAHSTEQVRPLLPGAAGCMVMITSRDRLTGLVATHDARRLTLEVLDAQEAEALLEHILGPRRVAAEPAAVTALAQACGHLPLALRIAAANLAGRPQQPIAGYLTELRAGDRLTGLTVAHDPQAAVRVAFDHSYHRLDPGRRLLYRLLGLVPGPSVCAAAAASLAGIGVGDAKRALEALAEAHLVQPRGRDRYAMHDLLKAYARERAHLHDGPAACEAALERLLGWYLGGVDAAANLLYPKAVRLPLPPGAATASPAAFSGSSQAVAWLEAELANLVAATRYAADHGPHPAAWLVGDALRTYFWDWRPTVEWQLIAQAGLDAATAAGDVRAQVTGHLNLGQANRAAGRQQPALRHHTTALTLARQAGWTDGQAAALAGLATVALTQGDPQHAAHQLAQAAALYRLNGSVEGQADSLTDLGLVERELGRLHEAAAHQAQALEIYRRIGSRLGEATALGALGEVDHKLGRLGTARRHLTSALGLHQELGIRFPQAYFLRCLAEVDRDAGHPEEALATAREALRLAREIGDPSTEAWVRAVLASIQLRLGHAHDADAQYRQSFKLAERIASPINKVRAGLGLADVRLALDRPHQALDRAHHAQDIAARTGLRILQGGAHITMAAAHHRLGHHDQALAHAQQAVELHRRSGHRLGEARALRILGCAHRDTGDPRAAVRRWHEALDLLTGLAGPEAEEIRTLLDA
ncbi:tetratricopeptide repeat protein [Nonomuraea phyllanthi]|uniref:Tetratricopeptide repeat protein n=1 Tax=Nonomuraea phyllanthi TaxID=2219224 RepID=A0A5C4WKK1_9ACTN|nr:tetratricopeptide repeat protein [Nonomuraea phyllanthi]KAB8194714.1 tetratricopeptide repeat protein [Nonomuraea phyllanthi]